MDNILLFLARAAGISGVILSVISGLARISGKLWIGGFEALTLLQAGIAGMTFGCLCFLAVIAPNILNKR